MVQKHCFLSSSVFVPLSLCFTISFLNPALTLSNSVQLEMPYFVCPNGLIRVLSETPPPFLTPPEVRLSPFSPLSSTDWASALHEEACSPALPSPHSICPLTLRFAHKWDKWAPQPHPVTNHPPVCTCPDCIPVLLQGEETRSPWIFFFYQESSRKGKNVELNLNPL